MELRRGKQTPEMQVEGFDTQEDPELARHLGVDAENERFPVGFSLKQTQQGHPEKEATPTSTMDLWESGRGWLHPVESMRIQVGWEASAKMGDF